MRRKAIVSYALLVACSLSLVTAAFAGVGTTGAQFLKIGPGARPAGMGGAFSAVADDLHAVYWNPAGLASQKDSQATASYLQYFQGINIGFLGYARRISERGTIGVGLNYLTLGGMERRTTDVDASEGSFGANDMALTLSYGDNKILARYGMALGANLKVIRQTIDTSTAQSFALDIGTLFNTPIKNLSMALGAYNIGTQVKFIEEGDPLPMDIRAGLAYRCPKTGLTVSADADDYINDSRITTQIGAEYVFKGALSVRAGYKLGTDASKLGGNTGFAGGLGVNVWGTRLDYAFVPYGELSNTQHISISTKF